MAIKLAEAGHRDVLILEKNEDVGGTWRDNHYPGAECDVPSALYSYSFERKTDWDYQWSEQPQILDYIHHVVDKHRLRERTRFNAEVKGASYDENDKLWLVRLAGGETLRAHYLVSAVGQLHKPSIPTIDGQDSFGGSQFHSADWDHAVDLSGKRVAVIGNAASAVQFVPPIAEQVGQLTVYQRSANWLAEKLDRPYTEKEKARLKRYPFIKSLARLKTYLRNELIVYPAMKGKRLNSWLLRKFCLNYLHRTVKDDDLRRKLTPNYPIGAKRILTANGYYEALCRDNVDLVTEPIARIDHDGVVCADGSKRPCDVIVYGTGFVTNPFLDGIDIHGRSGKVLAEHWSQGAHAYLGVATHDFPNLFFLYGPNTNLGHNSILLMSEAQVKYIIQAMQTAEAQGAASIEVRQEIETGYNSTIQARLARMAWSQIPDSWYMAGGLVTNNWPGSVGEYRRTMASFSPADYRIN